MSDENQEPEATQPIQAQGADEQLASPPLQEQGPDVSEDSQPVQAQGADQNPESIEGEEVEGIAFQAPEWANDTQSGDEGASAPQPAASVDATANSGFELPSEELQKRIQEGLKELGRYSGRLNGRWGIHSIFAIGKFVGVPTRNPNAEFAEAVLAYANSDESTLNERAWEAFADKLESGVRNYSR